MDHADSPAMPSKAWPFVQELVPLGGQLHALLSHMEQFQADGPPSPDAPPVPDVLASLLDGILAPLARHRPDDLATAAEILAEVGEAIESELFLTEAARSPAGRSRRSRPGRRG